MPFEILANRYVAECIMGDSRGYVLDRKTGRHVFSSLTYPLACALAHALNTASAPVQAVFDGGNCLD